MGLSMTPAASSFPELRRSRNQGNQGSASMPRAWPRFFVHAACTDSDSGAAAERDSERAFGSAPGVPGDAADEPPVPLRAEYKLPASENTRKYLRTVYDFPQWQKHRSWFRLIDRLLHIPQSHVIRNTVPSLAWCAVVSLLVTAYMFCYDTQRLPAHFPNLSPNQVCQTFISSTSVALSLLLVFRTNTAYGRWDEARKMWGALLNRSRDLMRQGCSLMSEEERELKLALGRWIVAFSRALRIHFQPEVTLEAELQDTLSPPELDLLLGASHRPVAAIHVLSHVILSSRVSPIQQMEMSTNLTAFHDVLGGCERLLRSPIPISYSRHTARFLFTWLTLLPLSLHDTCGLWTPLVVLGIAAVLCGIEEIGVQIEEPFGILPLDVICSRIQADVQQTLEGDERVGKVLRESLAW